MADNDKPDKSAQTATTGSPEGADDTAFVDDIIIWDVDLGSPRKLTQKALRDLPAVDSKLLPPLNSLIKQGVTIAAIPTTSGIGAACYLVNLATLKKPE